MASVAHGRVQDHSATPLVRADERLLVLAERKRAWAGVSVEKRVRASVGGIGWDGVGVASRLGGVWE